MIGLSALFLSIQQDRHTVSLDGNRGGRKMEQSSIHKDGTVFDTQSEQTRSLTDLMCILREGGRDVPIDKDSFD